MQINQYRWNQHFYGFFHQTITLLLVVLFAFCKVSTTKASQLSKEKTIKSPQNKESKKSKTDYKTLYYKVNIKYKELNSKYQKLEQGYTAIRDLGIKQQQSIQKKDKAINKYLQMAEKGGFQQLQKDYDQLTKKLKNNNKLQLQLNKNQTTISQLNKKLEKENTEIKQQNKALEVDITKKQEKLNKVTMQQKKDLKKYNETISSQEKEYKDKLKEEQDKYSLLQREFKKEQKQWDTEKVSLKQKITLQEEEKKKFTEETSKKDEKIKSLEIFIDNNKKIYINNQKQWDTEKKGLEQQISDKETKVQALQNKIEQEAGAYQDIKYQLSKAQLNASLLTQQVQKQTDTITGIKKSQEDLQKNKEKMKGKVNNLKQESIELAKLKEATKSKNIRIENLNNTVQQLKSQNEKAQKALNEEIEERLKTQNAWKKELDAMKEELTTNEVTSQLKIEEQEEAIKELTNAIKTLKQVQENDDNSNKKVIQKQLTTIMSLQNRLKCQKEAIAKLKLGIKQKRKIVADKNSLEENKKQLEEEIKQLKQKSKKDMQDYLHQIEQLKNKLREQKQTKEIDCAGFQKEIVLLKDEIEDQEKQEVTMQKQSKKIVELEKIIALMQNEDDQMQKRKWEEDIKEIKLKSKQPDLVESLTSISEDETKMKIAERREVDPLIQEKDKHGNHILSRLDNSQQHIEKNRKGNKVKIATTLLVIITLAGVVLKRIRPLKKWILKINQKQEKSTII
ncbi:MAG: hypothetical protein AAF770_01045 [Bacteroidota bacterium]